jgi:hypothetical protein
MYAGAGRAGDFAGDPLKTAAGFLAWLNAGQTSLRAEFGKTLHIPATAKMIYYKTNAIIARNAMSPKDQTVSAGVVPTLTAIAIPAGHEDGSYNPMPRTSLNVRRDFHTTCAAIIAWKKPRSNATNSTAAWTPSRT